MKIKIGSLKGWQLNKASNPVSKRVLCSVFAGECNLETRAQLRDTHHCFLKEDSSLCSSPQEATQHGTEVRSRQVVRT